MGDPFDPNARDNHVHFCFIRQVHIGRNAYSATLYYTFKSYNTHNPPPVLSNPTSAGYTNLSRTSALTRSRIATVMAMNQTAMPAER